MLLKTSNIKVTNSANHKYEEISIDFPLHFPQLRQNQQFLINVYGWLLTTQHIYQCIKEKKILFASQKDAE